MNKYNVTIRQKFPNESVIIIDNEIFADSSIDAHRKALTALNRDGGKIVVICKPM